jgi:PAS domain S-box-containing protein
MRRALLSSLRARLLLVVAVVLVPVVALTVRATLEQRRNAMRDVERRATALARSLADDRQARVFNRTRQFLRVVAALSESTGRDAGRCSELFAELVRLDRRYVDIGAATVTGEVVCRARGATSRVNIAALGYFRTAMETRGFAAGEYGKAADGSDVLVLAHAALGRDGRPLGVVFAELQLSAVDFAAQNVAVPDGWDAVLIDGRGRVLARSSVIRAPLGTRITDDALLGAVVARGEGTLEFTAGGVPHLFAVAPVRARNGDVFGHVLVGSPQRVAFRELNRATASHLGAIGATALLALALAWIGGDALLLRRARRTLRTTADALRFQARAVEEAASARRLIEEAFETEHAFVAAVLDTVGALVVVLDADGDIVRFNRACEATVGRTLADVRGRPFWDVFVDAEGREAARAVLEGARARPSPTYHESALVTTEGERRTIAWASTSVLDREESTSFIVATGIDISERKRAEDALRRSEATARAFLESAAEAVLITDPSGTMTVVNTQAERIFGYSRDELVGQSVELLIPERLRTPHVQHRARYMDNPGIVPIGSRLPLVGRRRDGTEFPVEVSLSFIETDDGLRVMAFVVDITERVAMQQRARQTDKLAALGTLAAGIAHEVNNPVGIISTRAELMLREPGVTEQQTADLQVVLRQARRVGKIVTGLLSFARQSPGTREPVDVNAIIDDTVGLVEDPMRKSRVALRLELDRNLPRILGDPTTVQQVILNLLTNAREAMTDGGEVRIETALGGEAADHVRVTVSDTGPGMPPDVVAKIFEPFYTTKTHGTGLGLAVSYGIVRDHGGTIDVESKPGEGTRFVLTFPVATARTVRPEGPPPGAPRAIKSAFTR